MFKKKRTDYNGSHGIGFHYPLSIIQFIKRRDGESRIDWVKREGRRINRKGGLKREKWNKRGVRVEFKEKNG